MKKIHIAAVVFILFTAGIVFALFLPSRGTEKIPTEEKPAGNQPPLFSDLRLGTPVRPDFATQVNPPIKQKTEYTVSEQIMLQGTTTSSAKEKVEVTVRLVDAKSTISNLSPSKITFSPGTNSYCCWTIKSPGEYVLQVFRPDSIVTRLPIKITKDFETTSTDSTSSP
ncbi:MAG TPA: hypothetical protein VJI96_00830 [Candidatus Andersenbacteria bacterium]|nr:hypothetical protein [Candidatus Andersenbacteria bacterium]